MKLQPYHLHVNYKKGVHLHLADTLSRYYVKAAGEASVDQNSNNSSQLLETDGSMRRTATDKDEKKNCKAWQKTRTAYCPRLGLTFTFGMSS